MKNGGEQYVYTVIVGVGVGVAYPRVYPHEPPSHNRLCVGCKPRINNLSLSPCIPTSRVRILDQHGNVTTVSDLLTSPGIIVLDKGRYY